MTDLIGHREARAWLTRALGDNALGHAYLITGPRGVGKRTFALEIARAVNCEAPDPAARPDGTCRQCRKIDRNSHPDLRIVKRSPERRLITLPPGPNSAQLKGYSDYVDFISAEAYRTPTEARRKVYLIVNAEELNEFAGNSLLKTLEEPPPFVLFLLTAVERGALMPTVASRCQEIRLHPAGRDELAEALVQRGADPERAARAAALAGGRQGWALATVADPELFDQQRLYARQIVDAVRGSSLERLSRARQLSERWSTHQETVRATLRIWVSWWRDVLLVQHGLAERAAHLDEDEQAALRSMATQISRADALAALGALGQALADLEANVNPRLVLDLLLLRLPRAHVA